MSNNMLDAEKADPTSSTVSGTHPDIDELSLFIEPKEEKKLLRRIDGFVITVLGALYLMCFLDRGNIGAANVATPSISKSLGLNPNQYGAIVSVVYATYVVFEPLWANLLKIASPKIVLGGTTVVWGIITLATAWAGTYEHMIALRLLLGVFEAALFPCITIYVLMSYKREETGRRMSYIFSCAAFAGAVGGLIAGGLVTIETGALVGWQYLYIVEGAISLALAPLAYFWIPNQMEDAWFLNKEQRKLAAIRYEQNKKNYNREDQFQWSEVRNALTDWTVWASGTVQFCADITLYGISTFMPQIIRSMGFSNTNANLLTVPVYFVGAMTFIVVAYYSDKYQIRSIAIIFGLSISLVGYIILATVEAVAGRYVGLFIVAAGLYITPGLNCTWIGNNTAGHFKRATAVGMNQLIGNSAGAAIGSIYISTLAPRYLRSMYISMGLTVFGIILAGAMALHWKRQNKIREKLIAEGTLDQRELGDKNPHFRYML